MCVHGRYAPNTVLVKGAEQRLGTMVDNFKSTHERIFTNKMVAPKNKSLLFSKYFHSLFGTCVIK